MYYYYILLLFFLKRMIESKYWSIEIVIIIFLSYDYKH